MFIENTQKRYLEKKQNNYYHNHSLITSLTIKEAIEEYLNWKKSYAETAADRYRIRLEKFAEFIGSKPLFQITSTDIANFHQNLLQVGNYAKGTVAYSIRILKDFFSFWNGRSQSNIQPKEIRNIRYVTPEKASINKKEFQMIVDQLDERIFEDLIIKLTFYLLWDTGSRVSEICDLNISDLIESSEPGMRSAKIRRRKTMRYNIISWGKETNRLLNLYLGIRFCIETESDALLITRKYPQKHITTRTVQRWVSAYSEKSGMLKAISPHSFRHAKAHRIINQSQNVRDVQAILGHVNPASSFNYLNLNLENLMAVSMKYLEV